MTRKNEQIFGKIINFLQKKQNFGAKYRNLLPFFMAFLTQKVPSHTREKKLGSYIKKEGCYDFLEKLLIFVHLSIKNLKKGFCSGTSNLHNFFDFQPIFIIFFANGSKL